MFGVFYSQLPCLLYKRHAKQERSSVYYKRHVKYLYILINLL